MEQEGLDIRVPPRWGKVGRHDGGYAPVDIFSRIPIALRRWDVIHAFEHRPNVSTPALLSRLRGTPLISDWSDWWTKGGITTPRRRFSFVDRWEGNVLEEGTKKFSDRVTVVSRALRTRAEAIGIDPERIDLVPSGCDTSRIHPLPREECRQRMGISLEVPVLCFSGFAFWDFRFLVETFKLVLEEFPDCRLLVVGQDKDGEIDKLVQEVLGGCADQVILAGRFDPADLEVPLGAADIQLLPLDRNLANAARWPIKFGDYLASGRPIATNLVGDTPAYINQYQVGIATEPDPAAYAEGIRGLLRNPEARERMGENALDLAAGPLSWEVQGKALEQAYLRCLGEVR
jgi:glycosyltransferase involved in cell wall biosynthesis